MSVKSKHKEKIEKLICLLENRDWKPFYQLIDELYNKSLLWLNEESVSIEQIEHLFYLVVKLKNKIKQVKAEGKLDLTKGTYLDLDDLTFYY